MPQLVKEKLIDCPLLLVVWRDAHGGVRRGWHDASTVAEESLIVHSVGHLLSKRGNSIIICPHITEENDIDGEIIIPKTWVVSMTTLKPGPRFKP